MNRTKKLTYTAILSALATVCSTFVYIPFGFTKAFPVQHAVNVLAAILLGPQYAVLQAVITSTLRVLLGTGSLFAYPGSIIGALFAAVLYTKTKKLGMAVVGEVIGTGFLGAMATYPLAIFVLGQPATLFGLVPAFLISSATGAAIGYAFLRVMQRSGALLKIQ